MQPIDFIELERLISKERLEPYLQMSNSDQTKAYNLYLQNLEECKKLYVEFHWLEIVLRNTINKQLIKTYGMEWYDSHKINFGVLENDKLEKSKAILGNENKPVNNPNMVASLTLGFWVNMFNGRYEELWRHCLRNAFPKARKGLKRKDLTTRLHPLLKLRNRIAHYEPVLKYNLSQFKQDITDILEWVK